MIQLKNVDVNHGIDWQSCIKTELTGKPYFLQVGDILFSARGTKDGIQVKVPTKDDVLADDETVNISITIAGQTIPDTAEGTIKDETDPVDPINPNTPNAKDGVFAEITVDKTTTAEGGKLEYTVKLVDAAGNAIEVPTGKTIISLSARGLLQSQIILLSNGKRLIS